MPDPSPTSKAAEVLARLRKDIILSRLAPSARLSLKALSAHYGVGTSPLREALFQLVSLRLVVLVSQKGFRVAPVSVDDLADVVATRRHLELHAFHLSLSRADAAWRDRVVRAARRLAQVQPHAGDRRVLAEDWQQQHRGFHFTLLQGCGSPSLLAFCEEIYDRFDRYRRIAISERTLMAGTAFDHDDLADAVASANDDRALRLLGRHLDDVGTIVRQQYARGRP